MTDETSIQISSEVTASNHAALAAFFENRSLVASQRYLDAVMELNGVKAELEELRASAGLPSQASALDEEHVNALTNLNRVNTENEELRASIRLMSRPRPQDEENRGLADLLRAFLDGGVFTKAATSDLVSAARRVVSPADVTGEDGLDGGAN